MTTTVIETIESTFSWEMNNTLLQDHCVRKEIKILVEDSLGFNENDGTYSPKLWDSVKLVLIGKFRALIALIKKLESFHTNKFKVLLKGPEKIKRRGRKRWNRRKKRKKKKWRRRRKRRKHFEEKMTGNTQA